jgi:heterodisulfide reductase subunit A-like polyferredoxin
MVELSGNGRNNGKGPVGAVLVVGAGIGGMQAALDLAESGLKVYLLDRSPAIGGIMAQLDKTFPTNDCAMCIMSPKLVEVGRHLNIEILTMAEVEGIAGEPGDFAVRIRQHPRYVDIDKCTGCGDCAEVCPISRPDEFNAGLSERRAIFKLYPQAIPNAFAIEKEGVAPCRDACPIHQRAQGYVALVRDGRYEDAYRTIREDNPFPSVCGRVCNHRCEDACSRGKADAPVNIMGVKRFVADWVVEQGLPTRTEPLVSVEKPDPTGRRVAVVGSGPAGLTCAVDLVRQGHRATVFEALPAAGGMMRVGVPEYRLPYDQVEREIAAITSEGVELVLNHRVDDVPALLDDGYDAVFVAVGAHVGAKLPIPGADLPEALVATEFLRDISLRGYGGSASPEGPEPNHLPLSDSREDVSKAAMITGRRVLVVGGGNVAIDAAMSAVRLGAASVVMACLESRDTMPAHDWEIHDAEEEGIQVLPSRTFKEVTSSEDRVSGMRCSQIEFRGFIDGRPDFDELLGTEEVIPADVVIFAIGQRPDLGCLGDQVATVRGRFVAVDPETLATDVPGIYAGGDAVTGTAFIVDAIAAGHKAARSIDWWLSNVAGPLVAEDQVPPCVELDEAAVRAKLISGAVSTESRNEMRKRPADERSGDFAEVYLGLTEAEAVAEAERCLSCGVCSECLQCVAACKADAIFHNEMAERKELSVGAVVLVPGVEAIAGTIRPEFGYGYYQNVVTSIEFERMLSASGPFAGEVKRPSDSEHPRKVAWIQCVGSRDMSCGQGYCSSVCCMYATKEAVIAKEHDDRIEPAIFYMDIRAYGKGFEAYVERAEEEHGVRYVRSMVSAVKEVPGTGNLRLSYATFSSGGRPELHEEEFEMVVLSVGLKPTPASQAMAERLGVTLNEFGFAESPAFNPTSTSRPGIFVAGAFAEPKDIPETVIEASCAAAQASALLSEARGTLTREPVYPPERDVSEEEARVGVFVCHCGINIGGVVDVEDVVEYVGHLPNVAYAERNLYTCSQDTQEKITAKVMEHNLNRVVVASCTPRTHEPLFQDTIRQAGLNPHLFELANIREQVSWVHRATPGAATEKAKELVSMAVAKARRLRPIQRGTLNIESKAVVIGGGLAGMTAALTIADQGFPVFLVEREAELGGHLQHVLVGFDGTDPQSLLRDVIARVNNHPRITVFPSAEVQRVGGYVGQFQTTVRQGDGTVSELVHGVVVVATGGREIEPDSYGYGESARVITQKDFESELVGGLSLPDSVVMIQCVGSRDDDHPYCSRICCSQAIKNALELKRRKPDAEIVVLYRDLRAYGFRERMYQDARSAGVVFIEFDADDPPRVQQALGGPDGMLRVSVHAQPEGEEIGLLVDRVVLSTGIEAEPGNEHLGQLLKLPLNQERFFLEAHVKLRPVDFAADGVFLCGLAHSPRSIDETIAQAKATAIRAAALLSKKELTATPIIASVNPRLCAACGICVDVCPYGARILEPEMPYAEVVEVLCQGCGACVVACPNKASQQKGFEFVQIGDMLDAALDAF